MESITLVVLAICIFLSFYLTFLSFQATDDTLKRQLVVVAAYSLITGVVMFACLTIYLGIKKTFSRTDAQLRSTEEPSEHD